MIGVSVTVKSNTALGTLTDIDGRYSLNVPDANSILVFNYVGYATKELAVNGQSQINVQLSLSEQELNQVVVIGYGSINKRDVTGAVKSISKEEFNKGIINSPEQLLQGRLQESMLQRQSGDPNSAISVTVRGPGGYARVRIHYM